MMQSLALAALLGTASAASWDYKTNNGEDWPDLAIAGNKCGGTNQSPIDLKTEGWPKFESSEDNFQALYTNQVGDIEPKWNGHTHQTPINKNGQNLQMFESRYPAEKWDGPTRFEGVQFHFHHPSEHSVDGKLHDLEVHTVHLPPDGAKNDVKYAALGVMFSVNDADTPWDQLEEWQRQTIDRFLGSLRWDVTQGSVRVPLVPYGDFMNMVDKTERWVYKGSVTTPPCDTFVYWNVVRKVWPIRQHHLDLFKKQLARDGVDATGNNRIIQKVDLQDPHVVYDSKAVSNNQKEDSQRSTLLVLVIELAITLLMLVGFAIAFAHKNASKK